MSAVIDVTERPVFKLGPDPSRIVYPAGVTGAATFGTAQANATVTVQAIAPESAISSPDVVAYMAPASIAGGSVVPEPLLDELTPGFMEPGGIGSGLQLGTASTSATSVAAGVAGSGGLGLTAAANLMQPTGISSPGASGQPSLVTICSPTGIASTEAFGDADTLATVFIIPGPVDPSNDFGVATATKKGWVFRTPVNTYQWRLFKEYEGISLLKENGVWSEVAHPDLERTRSAQKYLAGGRDHVVGDALKAELIAEGYTVTEEFVTTEEYL